MSFEKFIKNIALQAGEICRERHRQNAQKNVTFKAATDLVTAVDLEVEEFLVKCIKEKYPDHSIIGEETGKSEMGSEYTWHIDPIDGTTSYFHRFPFYSVSIALYKNSEPLVATVYGPQLEQLFFAEKGKGTLLNDIPIHVSQTRELIHAVLATGFACIRANLSKNNLPYFNRLMYDIRDIRRTGSAALDMAYVSAGILDGFWELNLNSYDIAAGTLLVTEAGGKVTDLQGHAHFPEKGTLATNGAIHQKVLSYFSS